MITSALYKFGTGCNACMYVCIYIYTYIYIYICTYMQYRFITMCPICNIYICVCLVVFDNLCSFTDK